MSTPTCPRWPHTERDEEGKEEGDEEGDEVSSLLTHLVIINIFFCILVQSCNPEFDR